MNIQLLLKYRLIFAIFLYIPVTVFFTNQVFASTYYLPYPSLMPGNKLYRISRLIDKLKNYWSFGNITQVKYHLALSDKYLVEAKTLFEYEQFLLADDALHRSTDEFNLIMPHIQLAMREAKNVSQLTQSVKDAASVHYKILENIRQTVPDTVKWTPEKTSSTYLSISNDINSAEELLLQFKDGSK
jgi:hypothetical protein